MSTPKATYVGREAAVLRALTNLALVNGAARDERSVTRPDWCITELVHIVIETSANVVDEKEWHYEKKTLGLRENKGATGKVMTRCILSFDEADVNKAKKIAEGRKVKQEEDAKKRIEWTEYLMRPGPNFAEKIYNRISTGDSERVIRTLATLPLETLQQIHGLLFQEEESFINSIISGSEKS